MNPETTTPAGTSRVSCIGVGTIAAALAIVVAGCAPPLPPAPTAEVQLFEMQMQLAQLALGDRSFDTAERNYQGALNRALQADNPEQEFDASYDLAIVLVQGRDADSLAEASGLARQAYWAAGRFRDGSAGRKSRIEALLLQAKIARLRHDRAATDALCSEVMGSSDATASQKLSARLAKLHAAADAGDFAVVSGELNSMGPLPGDAGVAQRATMAGVRGELARSKGQAQAAAQLFDEQANLLERAGLDYEMAMARGAAGMQWHAAGHPREAADRLCRAAMSLGAMDVAQGTDAWLDVARADATQAGDAVLVDEVMSAKRAAVKAAQQGVER